jgi:hypothetical protein
MTIAYLPGASVKKQRETAIGVHNVLAAGGTVGFKSPKKKPKRSCSQYGNSSADSSSYALLNVFFIADDGR